MTQSSNSISQPLGASSEAVPRRWKPYPEYKDSGVEWLGEIPKSWKSGKIKNFSKKVGSEKTPRGGSEIYTDDGILFIRSQNVYDSGLRLDDVVCIPAFIDDEMQHTRVQPNDVLLNITGASIGRSCVVPSHFYAANVNQHVCLIRPSKIHSNYLAYAVKSWLGKCQIDEAQTGAAREGLNFEQISNFRITVPPLPEQEKIAAFLDYECGRMDLLIEKQERLIELLKEKRQAVISHAVTKGLNPAAPMKDSGIEWLGEVPEHWQISRLGFETIVKARLGWKGLKADEYTQEGYIFLATPNIKESEIDFENVNYITEERYKESPEIMLQVGDVLVTKDGSTTGTTNVVKHLPAPATVNSSIAVIRPKANILGAFLAYQFKSSIIQNTIMRMRGGMGVPHLFQADLNKFSLVFPSIEEQLVIVEELDLLLERINTLIEKAKTSIDLTKERRTALISAAMTGKIDVRNYMPLRKVGNPDGN